MASFEAAPDENVPLEGVNREEEEDNRTQLEKDIASPSAVIPIWPWKELKDNMDTNEYARQLQDGKHRAFGENGRGVIRSCDAGDGECGSFFWRVNNTVEYERLVPPKWTNYGGIGQWVMCPLCKATELHERAIPEDMRRFQEEGRWDTNLKHGSTGSTNSDKPLQNVPTVTTSVNATPGMEQLSVGELKAHARELWKNNPKYLKGALQAIDEEEAIKKAEMEKKKRLAQLKRIEEERKKRAKAAESRKRKRTEGGKRRRKKRTKKRRKSRRRSKGRKRRKSRRRKRTRKRRR